MTKYLITAAASATLFVSACGGNAETNSNANKPANLTGVNKVDANNLPPGLSGTPIPPSANATPGIPSPANAVNVPKGATPTPGIPNPKEVGQPLKPGATPTPGIPSPEEVRRQLQQHQSNVNAPPPPASGESMMRNRKSPRPVNQQQ